MVVYADDIKFYPGYRKIMNRAEKEAGRIVYQRYPVFRQREGACYLIGCEKKRILKERFNIDWRPPRRSLTALLGWN